MSDAAEPSRFDAVPIDFSYTSIDGATWQASADFAGFEERDLDLLKASRSQMSAIELRTATAGGCEGWPQIGSATFALLYVVEGQIAFRMADGADILLSGSEAVHLPFLLGVESATWSGDLRLIQVVARSHLFGISPVPLLDIVPECHSGPWETAIVRNRPELFIRGDGPRKFFTYRDLGSARTTDRRIQTHDGDGASQDLDGGTGWHNHSMSQFFYVLGGSADIDIEGRGRFHLLPGDAMTISKGLRHDVLNIKRGYNVIEICLPADYTTVAQPAPN